MRLGGGKTWIVLVVVLLLIGIVASQAALHFWASHHLAALTRRDFA